MKKLLCLLPLLLLVSCLDATYVTQTFEFEGNRWPTTDAKTFKVNLEKDMEHATIKLMFSHVFEPQYASVPLSGTLTLPSGKTEPFSLKTRRVSRCRTAPAMYATLPLLLKRG